MKILLALLNPKTLLLFIAAMWLLIISSCSPEPQPAILERLENLVQK